MVGDFHQSRFGDLKLFWHQISRRLEIFVRLLHAHNLDDFGAVLFKVGRECFQERNAQFVTCAPSSAAAFGTAFFKQAHLPFRLLRLVLNNVMAYLIFGSTSIMLDSSEPTKNSRLIRENPDIEIIANDSGFYGRDRRTTKIPVTAE